MVRVTTTPEWYAMEPISHMDLVGLFRTIGSGMDSSKTEHLMGISEKLINMVYAFSMNTKMVQE